MAKYSFEFKLKVAQEYLDGKGGTPYLTKKYGLKSNRQAKDWINAYKEFDEEGLLRKRKNNNYSVQFKLNAIELYQTSEMSYREVANLLDKFILPRTGSLYCTQLLSVYLLFNY